MKPSKVERVGKEELMEGVSGHNPEISFVLGYLITIRPSWTPATSARYNGNVANMNTIPNYAYFASFVLLLALPAFSGVIRSLLVIVVATPLLAILSVVAFVSFSASMISHIATSSLLSFLSSSDLRKEAMKQKIFWDEKYSRQYQG